MVYLYFFLTCVYFIRYYFTLQDAQLKKRQERLVKEENNKKNKIVILSDKDIPDNGNVLLSDTTDDDESVSGGEEETNVLDNVLLQRVIEGVEKVEKECSAKNIPAGHVVHSLELCDLQLHKKNLPVLIESSSDRIRGTRKANKADPVMSVGKGGINNSSSNSGNGNGNGNGNGLDRRSSRGSVTTVTSAASRGNTSNGSMPNESTIVSAGSSSSGSNSNHSRRSSAVAATALASATTRTTHKSNATTGRTTGTNSTARNDRKSPTNSPKPEKKSPAGFSSGNNKSPVQSTNVRTSSKKSKQNLQTDSKNVCTTILSEKASALGMNGLSQTSDLDSSGTKDGEIDTVKEVVCSDLILKMVDSEGKGKIESSRDENDEEKVEEKEMQDGINPVQGFHTCSSKNPKNLKIITDMDEEKDKEKEVTKESEKGVEKDVEEAYERSVSVWDLLCNQDEISVRRNSSQKISSKNNKSNKNSTPISIPESIMEPELIVESDIIHMNDDKNKIKSIETSLECAISVPEEYSAKEKFVLELDKFPEKNLISCKNSDEKKEKLRIESDKFINEIAEVVEEGEEDEDEERGRGRRRVGGVGGGEGDDAAILLLTEDIGKSYFDLMNSSSPAFSFTFSASVSLSQFPTLTSPFRALQPHSSLLFSSLLLGTDDDDISDVRNESKDGDDDDNDIKIVKRLKMLQLLNSDQFGNSPASGSPSDVKINKIENDNEKVKEKDEEKEVEKKVEKEEEKEVEKEVEKDEVIRGASEVGNEKEEGKLFSTDVLNCRKVNDDINNDSNEHNEISSNDDTNNFINSISNSCNTNNNKSAQLLPIMIQTDSVLSSSSPGRNATENTMSRNVSKIKSNCDIDGDNDNNNENNNYNNNNENNNENNNNYNDEKNNNNNNVNDNNNDNNKNNNSDNSNKLTSKLRRITSNNSILSYLEDNKLNDNIPMLSPRMMITPRREKLTDTYSHIGMIFPVTYASMGARYETKFDF